MAWLDELQAACRSFRLPQAFSSEPRQLALDLRRAQSSAALAVVLSGSQPAGLRQQASTGVVAEELLPELQQLTKDTPGTQITDCAGDESSGSGPAEPQLRLGAGASSSERSAACLAACLAACRAPVLHDAAPAVVAAQRAHLLLVSGVVTWCQVCGAYGDARLRGLLQACPGPIRGRSESGRAAALPHLRNGRHPKTQELLPRAVPLR